MKWFWVVLLALILGCVVCCTFRTNPPAPVPAPPPPTPVVVAPSPYLIGGAPTATTYPNQWTVFTNIGYESAYDETYENPVWVAYHLSGTAGTAPPRPKIGYPTDPRSTARVSSTDYPPGYDHGHMAPNSAIATFYGANAQNETFFMTNMLPQRHALNAGPWKTVETDEIAWEKVRHDVWVIDGPVYTTTDEQPDVPTNRYGAKKISIPPYCFKVIVSKDADGNIETLAFIMPQENITGHKPAEFLTSIREVAKRAGLNFFPALPTNKQDEIEVTAAHVLWPVK